MIIKSHFLTAISLCSLVCACAQSKAGVEQYCFRGSNLNYIIMPVAHFQNAKNWYGEARYNYEDEKTFSLYVGKTFSNDDVLSYSFTPLAGGAAGLFNGISAGLNMTLDYKNFFFSSQSQYSLSTDHYKNNFYYNWSEIGYQPVNFFYTGVSLQQTNSFQSRTKLEPGVLVGFAFKKFSVPLYWFNLSNSSRYFMVGFNFEWESL